jgi:2-polyprenyl-6-hydroxyphenyl methylase/3-demethylubiquinone-9 3-methyltransferase
VNSQVWLSRKFDELLPADYRIDGNRNFREEVVPAYLQRGQTVYDIGGGKQPCLSVDRKNALDLNIVGIDIDADELRQAPDGAYDDVVCVDISTYRGDEQADIVICQALLEHVRDVEAAFAAIRSCLKLGGRALIFVPSRNAVFARLNILLPERLKRTILHTVFPNTRNAQGFPSFYDNCTPNDFVRMASTHSFTVEEARYFYKSSYFSFFFPFYFVWRIWVVLFRTLRKEQAAETFSMVLERNE